MCHSSNEVSRADLDSPRFFPGFPYQCQKMKSSQGPSGDKKYRSKVSLVQVFFSLIFWGLQSTPIKLLVFDFGVSNNLR